MLLQTMSPPRTVALRQVTASDAQFLVQLFASTRAHELALMPIAAAQKDALMQMQSRAQEMHYRHAFPDADYAVVEVDGVPAGRLYVNRAPHEIRLIEITLLSPWRGQGVGSRLLTGLLEEARSDAKTVVLRVAPLNPARALYEQLGFVVSALPDDEPSIYRSMRWSPPSHS